MVFIKNVYFMCIFCSSKVEILDITDPVQHAEGPFYDLGNGMLYYVDTFNATAFKYNPKTGKVASHKLGKTRDTKRIFFYFLVFQRVTIPSA